MTHELSHPNQLLLEQEQTQLGSHLRDDQFNELLLQPASQSFTRAEAHLLACRQCSAELAGLRDSLGCFRDATTAYADGQLRSLPQIRIPSRGFFPAALEPGWWAAAAALIVAALLPIQLSHRHAHQTPSSLSAPLQSSTLQSDEALLEDVDRDTSASVPASMQALVDPIRGTSSIPLNSSTSTASQRKD